MFPLFEPIRNIAPPAPEPIQRSGKETVLYFNFMYTTIKINSSVVIDLNCNAYTVINLGTTIAYINGVPLNPGTPGTNNGESISQGGNKGEIFRGRIDVGFDTSTGYVIVIQKIYLPNQAALK